MTNTDNSRIVAVGALLKIEKDFAYSNIVLNNTLKESTLSPIDKAFCTTLVYGVTERRITLDYIISHYLKTPLEKTDKTVLNILRVAVYQMVYMDKVPDSAAVNEAVKSAVEMKKHNAKGFINAVLRSFLRDNKKYTMPKSKIECMSIEYSVPQWVVKSFIADYGEDNAKGILSGFFGNNYLSIRVNTTKISTDELLEKLLENGSKAEKSEICEDNIIIRNSGSIAKLYGFYDGLFHVQDTASQLCCKALCVKDSDRIFDVCAAPGGKSFTLAEQTTNEVVSADMFNHKVKLIKGGANRLSLENIKGVVNDAAKFNSDLGEFDKVLCDLPCSGLGILGKKPEIRYKNVTDIDKLPQIQYDLLKASSKYVKMGGLLVYSTCSLRCAENGSIADKFLSENTDFEAAEVLPQIKRAIDEPKNQLTLMPHIHGTDGFFISAFRKVR